MITLQSSLFLRLQTALAWLACAAGLLQAPAQPAPGTPEIILTNTLQVRSLSQAEADKAPPIRLQGMITFSHIRWQLLFVQDEFGGCYALPSTVETNLPAGQWVEIVGSAGRGTYGPIIQESKIILLDQDSPARTRLRPRVLTLAQAAQGRDDAQWLEVTGVARSFVNEAGGWAMELGNPTANIWVRVNDPENIPAGTLVNSLVRVRGVCTVAQYEGAPPQVTIFCAKSSDVIQEQPSPAGWFQEPLLPIQSLPQLASTPEAAYRVRVHGRFASGPARGTIFLESEGSGVRVHLVEPVKLEPGDEVEVSGFITREHKENGLRQARARRLRAGDAPAPLELPGDSRLETNHLARLIRLDARLLQHDAANDLNRLTVVRPETRETFLVELPASSSSAAGGKLLPGSLFRFTGIWTGGSAPGLVGTLICREAEDLTLVKLPSWWTPQRVVGVIIAGLSVAILAVAWAVALRRQVRAQTRQIRKQIEQEHALERRYRDLVASASDAVMVLDAGGLVLDSNQAAERVFGRPRSTLIGTRLVDRLAPGDRQKFTEILAAPRQAVIDNPFEISLPGAGNGEPRVVEITSCRWHGEPGKGQVQLIAHDITARKRAEAELAELHRKLLDASRQAGMAEVATNVLHNVGNVLNSVNVSATLLADRATQSKAANLAKTAALLEEHFTNLATAPGPRLQMIPHYLHSLAEHFEAERELSFREIDLLRRNLDHIKTIVSTQQSLARTRSFVEEVAAEALFEEAVQLHKVTLLKRDWRVLRDFSNAPRLTVDRYKVVQILVNLIGNAKDALESSGKPDKELKLRIEAGGGMVRFSVQDNGVGIAPENLRKIFQHGFTTKPHGHGFGLHASGLAAKELGGCLRALSNGAGQGAEFVLELPAAPPGESTQDPQS